MKSLYFYIAITGLSLTLWSCGSTKSGGMGVTAHEAYTESISINTMDLEVDSESITYTIDISTEEGRLKLHGLNLKKAKELALQEAAMMNNAARIVSPKFTYLKEGKEILRITVFGFPARYKNRYKRD